MRRPLRRDDLAPITARADGADELHWRTVAPDGLYNSPHCNKLYQHGTQEQAKRSRKPAEITERFLLHMRTTRKLMGLIRRCNELREAGNLAQARKLFRQCEKLNEKLLELEDIGPRMH